jgi:hypothetical protein
VDQKEINLSFTYEDPEISKSIVVNSTHIHQMLYKQISQLFNSKSNTNYANGLLSIYLTTDKSETIDIRLPISLANQNFVSSTNILDPNKYLDYVKEFVSYSEEIIQSKKEQIVSSINPMGNYHSEQFMFFHMQTNAFMINIKNALARYSDLKHVDLLVLDIHSSHPMCETCSKAALLFANSYVGILTNYLTSEGIKTKILNQNIVIRVSYNDGKHYESVKKMVDQFNLTILKSIAPISLENMPQNLDLSVTRKCFSVFKSKKKRASSEVASSTVTISPLKTPLKQELSITPTSKRTQEHQKVCGRNLDSIF